MSPETGEKESPVIQRPTDDELLEKLRRKAQEYQGRITKQGPYTHPEQALFESLAAGSATVLDSMLKAQLLNEVLEVGEVRTWEFTLRMSEDPIFESAKSLNPALFGDRLASACAVIDAYCTGDYSRISGGTGLQ